MPLSPEHWRTVSGAVPEGSWKLQVDVNSLLEFPASSCFAAFSAEAPDLLLCSFGNLREGVSEQKTSGDREMEAIDRRPAKHLLPLLRCQWSISEDPISYING